MNRAPSVDKAVSHLRSLISSRGEFGNGDRLPPIEALARSADVSLVTMWKAVRRLAKEGLLDARRGAGIHVAPAPAAPLRNGLVDSVSQRLLRDIIEGKLHVDTELPSVKELSLMYNVGPRIIRDAVAGLRRQGHLVKRGRDFLIRRVNLSPALGASVVVIRGPDLIEVGEVSYFRTTIERFMHHFEQQSVRRNVRTHQVVVNGPQDVFFKSSETALGHIIWYTWSLEPHMKGLLEQCARAGKPTVVYDLTDISLEKLSPYSSSTVRILYNDNFAAGRAVGNALLHWGHRRVGYMAEIMRPWAQQRHAGLVSAFDEAGHREGVHLFPGDPLTKAPAQRPQAWIRADKDKWFLESLKDRVRESAMNEYAKGIVSSRIADVAYWSSVYCVMEKAMREAQREAGVTAWVAADDSIALYAVLPFLQARRVKVPSDLSVVAFNNQFETPFGNLSSYHFDMTSMAMRVLTFLLYPSQDRRLRPRQDESAPEGIGGFIVDRGSMGSARRGSIDAQARQGIEH